jgi:CRISPR/Cas system CSM-associated protein Csm3 (group 7 of RAMP superfamily)
MNMSVLSIQFQEYWHVGSGRGEGKHLDAVVDKDVVGLPYVPGRMLKGLLRDACLRLETWGHPDFHVGFTQIHFGSRPDGATDKAARHSTQQGCLYLSNAVLAPNIHAWLALPSQVEARQALYRQIHATAIDETRGCALKNSLRGIEVVVPVALSATLDIECAEPESIAQKLRIALPLIQSIGAHRSRGLGRAHLALGDAT